MDLRGVGAWGLAGTITIAAAGGDARPDSAAALPITEINPVAPSIVEIYEADSDRHQPHTAEVRFDTAPAASAAVAAVSTSDVSSRDAWGPREL